MRLGEKRTEGRDAAVGWGSRIFHLSLGAAGRIRHLTLKGGWDVEVKDRGALTG